MQPGSPLSEDLASRLEGFAEEHGIRKNHAYAVLVTVGLEVLDDIAIDIYVEQGQLILECERCEAIFDSTKELLEHEHQTEGDTE